MEKKSTCVGVIPARYASQRFPGKMLAAILGKSLVRRTYENALLCPALDSVVVATDEERIVEHVKGFGGHVVLTAKEHPTGSDRAAEAVQKCYPDAEIVVVIQGDEPCLSPLVVNQLIEDLKANPHADLTTPVEPLKNVEEALLPGIVKCVFDSRQKALYFSRSPIPAIRKNISLDLNPYYRHIGVYCYRRKMLLQYPYLPATPLQKLEDLEQLKILEHGFNIYVSIVHPQGVVAVDYPEDIQKVEAFLCRT